MAPILLIHGDVDHAVSVDRSTRTAPRLAQAKKTHELIILEYGTHGLDVERNRIGFLEAMERFLDRHLEPKGGSDGAP